MGGGKKRKLRAGEERNGAATDTERSIFLLQGNEKGKEIHTQGEP